MHPQAPPASGFGLRVLAELGDRNAVTSPLGLQLAPATLRAGASGPARAALVSAAVDPPFDLVADRPFTWAIEDAASGTLLFAGVVDDPTREETD